MRTTPAVAILAALVWGAPGIGAGLTQAAEESAYAAIVRADGPVAAWSFDDDVGAPAFAFRPVAGVTLGVPGPRPPDFADFHPDNRAAEFSDKGAVIKIHDPGKKSPFDFDTGDTIALEAWVDPDPSVLKRGQYIYVVGKGRTHNPGYAPENQNYALRLQNQAGQLRISFLFRSRAGEGVESQFHRWTAATGFRPGSGWHHIAVVYSFGKEGGGGLRAYLDGAAVSGAWDMGGDTDRPPVVDDDEVWIGASMGDNPGNRFIGRIDEVAIYRKSLNKEKIARRFRYVHPSPEFPDDRFRREQILVEIFETGGPSQGWPRTLEDPQDVIYEEAFGFFQLPQKYDAGGVRADRVAPFVLRAYAEVKLPKGGHEILLRSRGGSRLWIDGKVEAETPFLIRGSDGHGDLEPVTTAGGLRPPRLGDNETRITVATKGGVHRVVLDLFVEGKKFRPEIGEATVALRRGGDDFFVLSPDKAQAVPLTDEGWEEYRSRRTAFYQQRDTQRRRIAAAKSDDFWKRRHQMARAHVMRTPGPDIPEVPHGYPVHNPIDRFLAVKMDAARKSRDAEAGAPGGIDFARDIKPILADTCFRCHGEKKKGDLRLNDRAAALAGGESGHPAIVPGDPSASLLLEKVTDDGEDRMPPKGARLGAGQVTLLKQWIAEGARWSVGAMPDLTPLSGDLAFLRRLYLDTVGVVPSIEEIREFLGDPAGGKRARWIDRLLEDPRWADHWVSYWQDVLAENPNILKPSLNNSGPFRWWLYEALLDNKAMDRFVTDLVTLRGSTYGGGAAGFALATQNDVPLAAKAHILGTAFLGVEMKCARCHDAPYHSSSQQDLFQLAAMLHRAPLEVPESSSVPASFFSGRKALITVSLDPGEKVAPEWPFPEFAGGEKIEPRLIQDDPEDPRERLAAYVTRPENMRFAEAIVNRLWARYFGLGIVEPVHDWEGAVPSHPELLHFLARELMAHDYDLKHVARLILNSHAYQRESRECLAAAPEERFFDAPDRRRMTAEQLVDSLYASAGMALDAEELNFDPEGYRTIKTFLNLGRPTRAWQFASLSNERDRPSLSLPKAQAVVDTLEAFGWRSSRQEPLTSRDVAPNVLQPGAIANGVMSTWLTKLSDDSGFTELALSKISLEEMIEEVFLRIHTREPNDEEKEYFVRALGAGFENRVVPDYELPAPAGPKPRGRRVSWANHLNPEANTVKLEMERAAREGRPATLRLKRDWRKRMEDVVWALMNSPEMIFVP